MNVVHSSGCQVTAKEILTLLQAKHAQDVFVPECKNGPSQSGSHVRLDAWAMAKSWANPLTIGYEIKISRSDFLQDSKWTAYLPLCNQLYFVCPRGVIKPFEVPEQVGLMCVATTGSILVTKKKAPYREVQIPESLFRYILMCRVKIGAEYGEPSSRLEYWQQWLEERKNGKDLGYRVSFKIAERVREVESKNRSLGEQIKEYDDIRAILKNLQLPEHCFAFTAEQKIKELQALVPPWFTKSLRDIEANCKSVREHLEQPPQTPRE